MNYQANYASVETNVKRVLLDHEISRFQNKRKWTEHEEYLFSEKYMKMSLERDKQTLTEIIQRKKNEIKRCQTLVRVIDKKISEFAETTTQKNDETDPKQKIRKCRQNK